MSVHGWVLCKEGFGEGDAASRTASGKGKTGAQNAKIFFDEDGSDFVHWQRQFGEVPPNVAALNAAIDDALTASAIVVPEPTTFALIAVAVLLPSAARVRR